MPNAPGDSAKKGPPEFASPGGACISTRPPQGEPCKVGVINNGSAKKPLRLMANAIANELCYGANFAPSIQKHREHY